jgi:hypothetical protein
MTTRSTETPSQQAPSHFTPLNKSLTHGHAVGAFPPPSQAAQAAQRPARVSQAQASPAPPAGAKVDPHTGAPVGAPPASASAPAPLEISDPFAGLDLEALGHNAREAFKQFLPLLAELQGTLLSTAEEHRAKRAAAGETQWEQEEVARLATTLIASWSQLNAEATDQTGASNVDGALIDIAVRTARRIRASASGTPQMPLDIPITNDQVAAEHGGYHPIAGAPTVAPAGATADAATATKQ